MLLGFLCPYQGLSPCSCFRNKKLTLGLMETRFLAAPSPVSGLSQPPCTIFMKAVEFLMKVNAVQVSSMWSGGVGREVWSPSLGYYQRTGGKLQQAPFLGSKNKLWLPQMPSARGSKTTTAQKYKTVARQSIQTKMLVGDTVISGRRGSWGTSAQYCCGGNSQVRNGADVLFSVCSEMRCIIVMLPRHQYSFLVSDTCVCQSNFCVTCEISLSHTVISEESL